MELLLRFESVMVDIIELSKEVNFNFWPFILMHFKNRSRGIFDINFEKLFTLRKVLAILESYMIICDCNRNSVLSIFFTSNVCVFVYLSTKWKCS